VFCRVGKISPGLLPPPWAVWVVLADNYGILLRQAVPTTLETVGSFAMASGLGVTLAVAVTFSQRVREARYPNIVMFQLSPKVALAPLFIVWLGVGSQSCVTFGPSSRFSQWLYTPRPGWSAQARRSYGSAAH
jgi:NitT/TauT family transport system permease protein